MRAAAESILLATNTSDSSEHVLAAGLNIGLVLYQLHYLLFTLSFSSCILKALSLHMLTLHICLLFA